MALVTRAADPARSQPRAVWLDWEDGYLPWLKGEITTTTDAWGAAVKLGPPLAPGHHMPAIGPTGCAKTTHVMGVVDGCRKYALALDVKGEDETLAASGYVRVKSLPQTGGRPWRALDEDQRTWRQVYKDIEDGKPARVIVGGGARTASQDAALQQLMRDAITFCRYSGGWTLIVDEFELLSSQRLFHLGPAVERMLITARRDATSVLTTFQAPAWVSKHATRQARKAVVYPQSTSMVKNIADEMNWEWRELAAALDELGEFQTATIGRGARDGPMVLTKAPKL